MVSRLLVWVVNNFCMYAYNEGKVIFSEIYYLPSNRTGSMVLIFKDNKYWINNRYQNTINWTCRDRKRLGCNSCVQTTVEGRYIKHKGFHNHEDNYTKYNFNDWYLPFSPVLPIITSVESYSAHNDWTSPLVYNQILFCQIL